MLHLSGLILQSSSRGILPLRGANYVPAKLWLQVLWPQRADWQGPPNTLGTTWQFVIMRFISVTCSAGNTSKGLIGAAQMTIYLGSTSLAAPALLCNMV